MSVELFAQAGKSYPLFTTKGILISFLIREYTTSPPIADPPIPAMIILFTSRYSFFSVMFSLNSIASIIFSGKSQMD